MRSGFAVGSSTRIEYNPLAVQWEFGEPKDRAGLLNLSEAGSLGPDGVYRQVLGVFPSNSIVVTISPPLSMPEEREESTWAVGTPSYTNMVGEIASGASFETGDPDFYCIDIPMRMRASSHSFL